MARTQADTPPVRIVHLGLGAFHRAHQVWFTQQADPGWGIAAFSGRSTRLAATLAAQDCAYTLVERGPDADVFRRMTSLVRAGGADQPDGFDRLVADPSVSVVTMTVTEGGYEPGGIAALRLLRALDLRRRSTGAGPIAVVPCDNIRGNGARIRSALLESADGDHELEQWLGENVSFVDTVSDRITPATSAADIDLVARETGRQDCAPVVTEPFAEWVLSGEFPAGRPAWEQAGARFVDDIRPFELRKLRLLNGGHLLLALAGLRRGHTTVAEAMADPGLRRMVEEYWSAAAYGVPEAEDYLREVRARFANARIRHRLEQIAMDAEAKLRERIVPVVNELIERGADPTPAMRVVAAWLVHAEIASSAADGAGSQCDAALEGLAPGWARDRRLRRALDDAFISTFTNAQTITGGSAR
jgi:fructuronate reductase